MPQNNVLFTAKSVHGTPQASRPGQLFWICWFDLAGRAAYFATPPPGSLVFGLLANFAVNIAAQHNPRRSAGVNGILDDDGPLTMTVVRTPLG